MGNKGKRVIALRGCRYSQDGRKYYHGLAVLQHPDDQEPMFIIPLDVTSIHDIVGTWEALELGTDCQEVNVQQ